MRLLAISGSVRRGSYNSALLAAVSGCGSNVELVLWRRLAEIPAFDADVGIVPSPVADLLDEIAGADAVLIATPEYNGAAPGSLKNALDWASRPFPDNALRGKPVAVIGASTGSFGAVWAQAEMRRVLKAIGASVLDAELAVPAARDAFTSDGRLRDGCTRSALCGIVDELARGSLRDAA